MTACPRCGGAVAEDFRFCPHCGAAIEEARRAAVEVRKVVTVLFIDVAGSTALGERLDPESLRRVMHQYFEAVRQAAEAHGGTIEKFIGDAAMAVFGVPVLHEDDALRAVRAAMDVRTALATLNQELERDLGLRIEVRTGINTGEVIAEDPSAGQAMVTGDAVNTASRLEQAARPGEILMGEATWRLTRNAVRAEPVPPMAVKGKEAPLASHRVLGVGDGLEPVVPSLVSSLVGRGHELSLAQEALQRATRELACHLFTVLGPPGIGKSRLSAEIVARAESEATALVGRCLPYGKGITFWPVIEIIRAAGGLTDTDTVDEARDQLLGLLYEEDRAAPIADRLLQLVGLGAGVADSSELFWAVRRLFEAMARRRPLVIVFEDIHWAEPTLLDLIEHVADWSREAPMLLLCVARPELLEIRPAWGGGKRNASSILLEPLDEAESEELMVNLLDGTMLPEPIRRQIANTTEGNPLYVEQLLAMLIDVGVFSRTDGGWEVSGQPSAMAIPPTIQLLLAARLDGLGKDEQRVIQIASVVGKQFSKSAVGALFPEADRPAVSPALAMLVRKDLIQPERSSFAGDDSFRFRHLLIRDAAYRALPKKARADLHERFADWLMGATEGRGAELEEILGYHLQEAFQYRTALAPIDDRARGLASRAGRHLADAGRRALDRGDAAAAVNLLERASRLLDPCPPDVMLDVAAALFEDGQFTRAVSAAAEAKEAAVRSADRGLQARATLEDLTIRLAQDTEGGVATEMEEAAPRAIAVFEELGDHRSLGRAWLAVSRGRSVAGAHREMLDASERALDHARLAGDVTTELWALSVMGSAMRWGPTPVEEALGRAQALLEQSRGRPLVEARAARVLGDLKALNGDLDGARQLIDRAEAIYTDLGRKIAIASMGFTRPLEWMAGDLDAAERVTRESCNLLEGLGERGWLSTIVGALGRILCGLERYQEADLCAARGRELAAADDLVSQILWRAVRAKVRAWQGEAEEARALIREAVDLATSTEGLLWQADAYQDLADVMRLLADRAGEAAALREALRRYEVKGVPIEADRMRHRLDALAGS